MDLDKETRKQEDEYFARIEFEKRKKALEERHGRMKKEEKSRLKDQHWMHCPKCGMEMVEITFEGIKVDKCSECLGIFFDNGEVDQLIDKNRPGFLSRMADIFKD
jgi:protein-arginine kinase activator protein McsA